MGAAHREEKAYDKERILQVTKEFSNPFNHFLYFEN